MMPQGMVSDASLTFNSSSSIASQSSRDQLYAQLKEMFSERIVAEVMNQNPYETNRSVLIKAIMERLGLA